MILLARSLHSVAWGTTSVRTSDSAGAFPAPSSSTSLMVKGFSDEAAGTREGYRRLRV